MKKWILLFIMISMLGCSKKNEEKTNIQSGKELYGAYCASCHRDRGTGNFLFGIPRIKDTELTMSEIDQLIRYDHKDDKKMPMFSQLTSPQAYSIASYIKKHLRYQ
ncbi:c-type cytochrome [Marinomonas gallaica]|uniref:c-type cytochrome n=1 Tax=Marinomonas gallaica TaxID=1806667 RepID=UPI00082B5DEF|nr:cytochrome c [Marinomonas gallaica]